MTAPITTSGVWAELARQSFAVLAFVNPGGEARSAGVNYVVRDRKLYVNTGGRAPVDQPTASVHL